MAITKVKELVSVRIHPDVLARVERVAEQCEESRSEVLARIIANGIGEEEKRCESVGNPVMREIVARLLESPKILRAVAAVVGEQLSDEQLAEAQGMGDKVRRLGAEGREERQQPRMAACNTK